MICIRLNYQHWNLDNDHVGDHAHDGDYDYEHVYDYFHEDHQLDKKVSDFLLLSDFGVVEHSPELERFVFVLHPVIFVILIVVVYSIDVETIQYSEQSLHFLIPLRL